MELTVEDMGQKILPFLPKLRVHAWRLAGNKTGADDLVQETVLRALNNASKFEAGTNLSAWLTTILYNRFFSEGRKRKRIVEDVDGKYSARLTTVPNQEDRVEFQTIMTRYLPLLRRDQQEVLYFAGYLGFSMEEIAIKVGVSDGTVKSRLSRARAQLQFLIEEDIRKEDKSDTRINFYSKLPSLADRTHTVSPSPTPIETPQSMLKIDVGGTIFIFLHAVTLPDGRTAQVYRAAP